ncbi:hypothetical protein D9M69_459580 [compost metagenome]
MISCRSKSFWIAFIIFLPPLLIGSHYGFKTMTSVYKTDMGNGVVIYADDYVKTGRWVFHCGRSRLISREPLPAPLGELKRAGKITIGNMYGLNDSDEKLAKDAILALTAIPDWYRNLRYLYSVLDENSDLNSHVFDLLMTHKGRQWAFRIWQEVEPGGKSSFDITAVPYDSETYLDHARALQAAARSCPTPQ